MAIHFFKPCRVPILLLMAALSSCGWLGSDKENSSNATVKNYMVLLDLSDRIYADTNQVDEDKIIVLDIFSIFMDKARQQYKATDEDLASLKGKLNVIILPRGEEESGFSVYEERLSIDFAEADENTIKYLFSKRFEDFYVEMLTKLYDDAIARQEDKVPAASDFVAFFHNDLDRLITKEPNSWNYLFTLTDGETVSSDSVINTMVQGNRYSSLDFGDDLLKSKDWQVKFSSNDYGLVSVEKAYPNLSVMMLEAKNQKEPKDVEFLNIVWEKWLNEMDVQEFRISRNDAIGQVQEEVYEFLNTARVEPGTLYAVEETPLSDRQPVAEDTGKPVEEAATETDPVIVKEEITKTASVPVETPAADQNQGRIVETSSSSTGSSNSNSASRETVVEAPVVTPAKKPVSGNELATIDEDIKIEEKAPVKEVVTNIASAANITTNEMAKRLNTIADRAIKTNLKRKMMDDILAMCNSKEVDVKLLSDSNMLIDRYKIPNYLSRINLLGKYQVEVIDVKKSNSERITEIVVKETRR